MPTLKNRSFWLRLLGSALSGGLIVVLLAQNWQNVLAALRQVTAADLLLALGLVFASRLFTVARWHTLLRAGGLPISFGESLSLTFTGLFASNFLPTTIGGDAVRLAGITQRGYDGAVALASLAADRLVNMAGMSLAAPLGLWQVWGASQAFVLPAFAQKIWGFLRRTAASLTLWLHKPQSLALSFLFALAHMLCMFSANYVLLHALGGELPLWRIIGLFSLSYFIGLLPVSVNGYGWQEFATSSLLATLGGVDLSVSATVAIFHRLLMLTASLPGALTLPGIMAAMQKQDE